jgi:hypothetical protein
MLALLEAKHHLGFEGNGLRISSHVVAPAAGRDCEGPNTARALDGEAMESNWYPVVGSC